MSCELISALLSFIVFVLLILSCLEQLEGCFGPRVTVDVVEEVEVSVEPLEGNIADSEPS